MENFAWKPARAGSIVHVYPHCSADARLHVRLEVVLERNIAAGKTTVNIMPLYIS